MATTHCFDLDLDLPFLHLVITNEPGAAVPLIVSHNVTPVTP
jgi:hypothetical protein